MSNTIIVSGSNTTTTGNLITSSGTTTHTTISNPYTYNPGYTINPTPFNIAFEWQGKQVDVSLKNGNDIFKLVKVFINMLEENNIEYNIKTKNRKKKR